MIIQTNVGLTSRSEANCFDEEGLLPLITAPMNSVVNAANADIFLDKKIQVCLPRNVYSDNSLCYRSMSLKDSIPNHKRICIDTANGNNPNLHSRIKQLKSLYPDVTIMSGNVASVAAFRELAINGCDEIRVGIGGGGGCSTFSNVGVGQENLGDLIWQCYQLKRKAIQYLQLYKEDNDFFNKQGIPSEYHETVIFNSEKLSKVIIIADGISQYISQCNKRWRWNVNGYAAINSLLYLGADKVMIGSLFAKAMESAGLKRIRFDNDTTLMDVKSKEALHHAITANHAITEVQYAGMSTIHEQVTYSDVIKPSEGMVKWIPVEYTLDEWLNGADNQDEAPYLMGWINSIKSAMSYVGAKTLNEFKKQD